MIRARSSTKATTPTRMLYSSRVFEDVIYYDELEKLHNLHDGLEVFHTLTRGQPPGWRGFSRRIDREMLKELIKPFSKGLQVFICGPTLMVESAADGLVQSGIKPVQIKTERFGPTGAAKGA